MHLKKTQSLIKKNEFEKQFHITENEYDYFLSIQKSPKRLLTDTENKNIDLNVLYTELEKKKKQIVNISPQDFDKTKELFKKQNIIFFFFTSQLFCFILLA